MTREQFWRDPYQTRLETAVATVDGPHVTLVETIFFALSGGQESDHGTIGGHPVAEARKAGREIIYTLRDGHGLKPGDPVAVEIDGERRYRLMRLHFAAELILELVYRRLPGVEKIGAHIARDKARIDFALDTNISSLFPELTDEANRIVSADQPIITGYSDEAAERRYWKIDGFAEVPCGGTHVRRTGEIGPIALKRKNIGKAKERIEITAADPA